MNLLNGQQSSLLLGEVGGWLEKCGLAASLSIDCYNLWPNLYKSLYTMEVAI